MAKEPFVVLDDWRSKGVDDCDLEPEKRDMAEGSIHVRFDRHETAFRIATEDNKALLWNVTLKD